MYNLLIKDLKLGVNPFFYVMPILTGALMLVPAWLYFVVFLYFCAMTIPGIFASFKTNNDLIFSTMMPVSKDDIVKARMSVIILLELLHIITAVFYGTINTRLYPDLMYYFLSPSIGFWGLSFVMLGVFNIIFIPMFYKTAYKYGAPTVAGIVGAVIFAAGAEWVTIKNTFLFDLFKVNSEDYATIHLGILLMGIFIFILLNWVAYLISVRLFKKVEI